MTSAQAGLEPVGNLFTSFQPVGSTVINFVIVSPGLLPRIKDSSICITQMLDWSDHAAIEVTLTNMVDRSYGSIHHTLKPVVIDFGAPTKLDIMGENTLKTAISPQEVCR